MMLDIYFISFYSLLELRKQETRGEKGCVKKYNMNKRGYILQEIQRRKTSWVERREMVIVKRRR